MQLLALICLTNIVLIVCHSDLQKSNVTLLVEELEESFEFTCILEGSLTKSGVTWITPAEIYQNTVKPSMYVPVPNVLQDYESDTENTWKPPGWYVSTAFDYPLKPVTDYRWEGFPIYTSSHSRLVYLTTFSKESFSVSLSVRIQNEGTLHLCDDYPGTIFSNCFVVFINKTHISASLENDQSSTQSFPSDTINENEWVHLNIHYSSKDALKLSVNNNTRNYVKGRSFVKQLLYIQSKELSLWKLHTYNFLTTNKSSINSQIGPAVEVKPNTHCFSLHVALCHTCTITITTELQITPDYYQKEVTEEVKLKKKSGMQYSWKEVKIIREVKNIGILRIFLTAYNTENSHMAFWAVDDIRKCDLNEVRVANLNVNKNTIPNGNIQKSVSEKIKCQPLRGKPISISKPHGTATENCQDQTKLGLHCNITCKSIFGKNKRNCERKTICMGENADGTSNCHCAFGFQGLFCEDECETGTWGLGCKGKCVNCKNNKCNKFSGTCAGCIEGFIEPNCTNPIAVQNLRKINSTSDSITIQWDSPASLTDMQFIYVVKYRHKKYMRCKMELETTSFTETTTSLYLKAESLFPYSEYIFEVTSKVNEFQGTSESITVPTISLDILKSDEQPSDLQVTPGKIGDYPLMTWMEPPCSKIRGPSFLNVAFTCLNDWCKTNVSLKVSYSNNVDVVKKYQQPLNFTVPYSDYVATMTLERNNKGDDRQIPLYTQFQTNGAAPPKVLNLTVYSRNESTISLRWKPPYPPYGQLKSYILKCFGQNGCESKQIKPTPCIIWDNFHCGDLIDLPEDREYYVQVQAINKEVSTEGKEDYTPKIYTRQSKSDPPSNVRVQWDKDVPFLQWDHPDITNGPLVHFYIESKVIESENLNITGSNETVTINKYERTYSHEMQSLEYSTVYEITVYAVNKFKGNPSESRRIAMPPPTPSLLIAPKLKDCSNLKCKLTITRPVNISGSSFMYVIVHNDLTVFKSDTVNITDLLRRSANNVNRNQNSWLAVATPIQNNTDDSITIMLGNSTSSTSKYGTTFNKPLTNGTYYISVFFENVYLNKRRFSERQTINSTHDERTPETNVPNTALYGLFSLLLIPVAVIGGWIIYRKQKTNQLSITSQCKWLHCFKRSGSETELVALEESKPTAVVKPKRSSLEGLTKPLLSTADEEIQYTCKISLKEFEEFVKEAIGTNDENGELVRQHNLFIRGQTKPWEYGLKKQNKFKNRYNNLIAYDHTRVRLEKINRDEFSDYINANYIDGYKKSKAYIATQGPKPTTVCDFWRMIWQEQVTTIVMVANVKEDGKKKTEQYWPNINTSQKFGAIDVYHNNSEVFANYIFRTLTITKDDEQHTIQQLHFTSWPDHGVPLYPQSLVPFIKTLTNVPQESAPIVVHCSAGVGRTGTIILCDIILRMAAAEGTVDFLATLQQMRNQRANLVDNSSQYILAHLVVLEALFGLNATITCDHEIEQNVEKLIHSDELYNQMEYLEKVSWQDQALRPAFVSPPNPENRNKNRFSYIVPDGYGRIYLSRYPASDEHSDYINAVEVDGFQTPRQFIVTQQPLPHTISDFWRMIHEKEVTTIVSLNDIISQDESSAMFWPEEDEVFELLFARVSCTDKEEFPTHDVIKVSLTKDEEYKQNVNVVSMKGWAPMKTVPNNLDSLIAVWEETAKLSRGDNPTVVTCYDGAKACGIYVALSFVIEKIKLEQLCDVCLAVRTIRLNRKQFMTNVEQFELLYKVAVHYLKGFETYSNFPITSKEVMQ